MEQESIYKNIAVIGCGASGGFASVLLSKNPFVKITAFDMKEPFSTLLPTGGGRCNLSYNEEDVREFVKNYPRGEKFLLSVFSKFGVNNTRKLFLELGIKTYVQEDNRIFPVSNSALKTVETLRKHLNTSNFVFRKEEVISVNKDTEKFIVKTKNREEYFDYVIISTGGKGSGFSFAEELGHSLIPAKPSLTSLDIAENNFYKLAGLSFKNVEAKISIGDKKYSTQTGDFLFAHKSITGPLVFKISALTAFEKFNDKNPVEITLKLTDTTKDEIEDIIKINSKKTVKNVFSKFAPEKFIEEILKINSIDGSKQSAQLKKDEIIILINALLNLKFHAKGRIKDSEIVTAGGVELNEINSKTMESKIIKQLYFIGEILNIDGYTGGFNLQNCWSTAYIVSLNFN